MERGEQFALLVSATLPPEYSAINLALGKRTLHEGNVKWISNTLTTIIEHGNVHCIAIQ